jgi:hypothetical protein
MEIDPRLIFNTDETQARKLEDHRRLACRRKEGSPVKEGTEPEEHRTLVLFVSADGESLKPAIIFPLRTAPPLSRPNQQYFDIAGSDSGWITGSILKTTIEKLFLEKVEEKRRKEGLDGRWALLLLDNHSSRLSLADEQYFESKRLKILPIPPHSSALLQPLDLGPNLVLKQQYSKWCQSVESDNAKERKNRQLDAVRTALSQATCMTTVR